MLRLGHLGAMIGGKGLGNSLGRNSMLKSDLVVQLFVLLSRPQIHCHLIGRHRQRLLIRRAFEDRVAKFSLLDTLLLCWDKSKSLPWRTVVMDLPTVITFVHVRINRWLVHDHL